MAVGGAADGVLAAAVDRVDDGIVVLDGDGRCTYVNVRASELLGLTRADVVGLHAQSVFPGAPDDSWGDHEDASADQEPRRFAWQRTGLDRAVEVRVYSHEDGCTVHLNDDAESSGERAAESSDRRFAALIESTSEAIYIKNEAGRLEFVNRAAADLFGLEPEDVIGQYDVDLFDEHDATEIRDIDTAIMTMDQPDTRESVRHVDGERRVFLENTFPYHDEHGAVIGVMGISRDITRQDQRERTLQQKHDRLDEFASVVSHDLLNPITVAQGRLALARAEGDTEHLAALGAALDRIEAITTDTLTLARQGRVVTHPEPVWMTDLVGRCWAMVGAETATLRLDDEFTIMADSDRLQHVFENLFRNSVEHGSTDSRDATGLDNAVAHGGANVTVHIGRLGDDGFYVEDDGPGIPPADRDAVFDPTHVSEHGGTGFGLTIVKRIALAHGWSVAIVDGRHGGARFEFSGVDVS